MTNQKQKLFHVEYFYLATGMEGIADKQDYGEVYAKNAKEAKEIISLQEYPKPTQEQESFINHLIYDDSEKDSRRFFYGCLSATQIK